MFTCQIDSGHLGWIVNGTELHDLPQEISNNIRFSSMPINDTYLEDLSIPAKEEYDNVTFQCVAVGIPGTTALRSEIAILRIQGRHNLNRDGPFYYRWYGSMWVQFRSVLLKIT